MGKGDEADELISIVGEICLKGARDVRKETRDAVLCADVVWEVRCLNVETNDLLLEEQFVVDQFCEVDRHLFVGYHEREVIYLSGQSKEHDR